MGSWCGWKRWTQTALIDGFDCHACLEYREILVNVMEHTKWWLKMWKLQSDYPNFLRQVGIHPFGSVGMGSRQKSLWLHFCTAGLLHSDKVLQQPGRQCGQCSLSGNEDRWNLGGWNSLALAFLFHVDLVMNGVVNKVLVSWLHLRESPFVYFRSAFNIFGYDISDIHSAGQLYLERLQSVVFLLLFQNPSGPFWHATFSNQDLLASHCSLL